MALAVKIRNQSSHKRRERSETLSKESDLNCRAVAAILKAVRLSPGLKLGNGSSGLIEKSGTVDCD